MIQEKQADADWQGDSHKPEGDGSRGKKCLFIRWRIQDADSDEVICEVGGHRGKNASASVKEIPQQHSQDRKRQESERIEMKQAKDNADENDTSPVHGSFEGSLNVATKKKLFAKRRSQAYHDNKPEELHRGTRCEDLGVDLHQLFGNPELTHELFCDIIARGEERHGDENR